MKFLQVAKRWGRIVRGLPTPVDTADRRILEDVILPYYAERKDIVRLLSVGVNWYTRHYADLVGPGKVYRTLDIDFRRALHGSPHHIIDSVTNVRSYFEPNSLDLIVFNGVFGWGLNQREDMEQTLDSFHTVLRPGGELVFGWNDVPDHAPFPPSTLIALGQFDPLTFEPLGQQKVLVEGSEKRHTFEFYRNR